MLDMNKYIVKTDDNQPFHTSGYAQTANGNRIGAVSTSSFERRQQIEKNRQRVGGYKMSTIGAVRGALKARPVTDCAVTSRTAINNIKTTAQPVQPKTPYNPYS